MKSIQGAGLRAMATRPFAPFPHYPIKLSRGTSSAVKSLNLRRSMTLSNHGFLKCVQAGGSEILSVEGAFMDRAVKSLLHLKSPGSVSWRRHFSASRICSDTEIATNELPKKPPRQPRKKSTNLKCPAKVETQQSTAADTSRRDPWSTVESWVVFSDLHFSRRTRDTCLQVLKTVHEAAAKRKAGIVFLGDFWHARGALPVELLNVVVTELAKWQCPAIFIPGNHDQVNMGGQMHALMVLGAVNPLIKVFDDPIVFLDALWIPFRRDHNLIKQAIQEHPEIKAIFAHLDVVGAYMNEASQAKEGIEPSIFPQDIPIFTGHYHKPHVVTDTHIEYIGSPYQVSASETGQAKRFLLLNKFWEKVGVIPIDIGGRHFVVSDTEKFSLESIQDLRRGDRVRLLLSTALVEEPIKADVEMLQNRGVEVDLVFPILTSKPRIQEAENLDAFGLFGLYAERIEMSAGARNKGFEMLQNMDLPAKLIQRPQVQLVLQHVEIQGFGPYLDPVKYPLAQRGIRVVCGRNMDSVGADSNGAGKSTLVMAPLWALSGSTDPRPDSIRGLSASDVINEKAKSARVCVEGTVNGQSFMVERTAGRKSSLRFYFNGVDWTGQDIKLTQAKIDEIIDTSMLQRVAFHGQYGIGGLLEASDKDFKDELSKVIGMDLWIAAKKNCLQELRTKQTEVDCLQTTLTHLQQQKQQIAHKVEESVNRIQGWERNRDLRSLEIARETEAAVQEFEAWLAKCSSESQKLQTMVHELEVGVHRVEQVLVSELESWQALGNSSEMAELDTTKREFLMTKAAELSVELRNAEIVVKKLRNRVNDYRLSVSGLDICVKCLQPISTKHFSQSLVQLEAELAVSQEAYEVVQNDERMTREELHLITKAISEAAQRREADLKERRKRSVGLQETVNRIRKCLTTANSVLCPAVQFLKEKLLLKTFNGSQHEEEWEEFSYKDGSTGGSLESISEPSIVCNDREIIGRCYDLEDDIKQAKTMGAKVEQLRQVSVGLKTSNNPFSSECHGLKNILVNLQASLKQNEILLENAQNQAGWLKELDTAFGHTGVQSYVLEAALTELQERTARFLEVLSGGSLGLRLLPTKELKRSKTSVETIDRIALVRSASGMTEQRSLRQLSGGERRRQTLGLALGFAEFASQRSGLHCDLLVLDEVLQHLDCEGKARVVAILKGLPQSTIILVAQTYGDVADAFDLVDVVVKQNDTVRIEASEAL